MWDTATLLNHRLSHDTLPSCLQSLCSAKRTSDWLLPKISALEGFSQPDVPQNSRPSHLKFKQEVNMQHSFTNCWDSKAAVYKLNRRRPGQTVTLLPLSCCWFLYKRIMQTRDKLRQQGDRETYKKQQGERFQIPHECVWRWNWECDRRDFPPKKRRFFDLS